MLAEELRLDNIKCFEQAVIPFIRDGDPCKWVTFLSQNGGGKSTALQALGLLLAGPEGAQKLLPRPVAWLRDESRYGTISTRVHQGESDPGQFASDRVTRRFGYSFFVTGTQEVAIRNRKYSEPAIVESVEKRLSWLRGNAFTSTGEGWFAVGYGAFRRLTRSNQIIVPSLEPQARFTNFATQFNEDEPLSAFERWMVYLDYRISKRSSEPAVRELDDVSRQQHLQAAERDRRRRDLAIAAINQLLPDGVEYAHVSEEGRVCFKVDGVVVPTTTLSDGYRSIIALAGDLVWRLILAFPHSDDPLREEGVVLIDELDIHLHPVWQRQIAGWLREQFPNLQFIVATHSPLIAAGAGEDALTYRFSLVDGRAQVVPVDNLAFMSVDRVLQSDAFGLVSPFSPQAQAKIDRYDTLSRKGARRRRDEEEEFGQLRLLMDDQRPFGGPPEPGSLDARIEAYLEKALP